jgi:hypothetical protein
VNKALRAKKEEVKGGQRKLHNGERHNLYSSPNITTLINSRTMKLAGNPARMGEMRDV